MIIVLILPRMEWTWDGHGAGLSANVHMEDIWDHLGIIWDNQGISWEHLGDTWCHLVVILVDSDNQIKFLSE